VVCDRVDACKAEAGEHADEITLFKSVGLAIQDISAAYHVYTRAQETGTGIDFEF